MRKLIIAIALTALAGIAGVQAQTYPSRQITIVVPFPPGGSTDVAGRIMAEKMRPLLGQPVIIENVGGAGGSIAVGRVARAAPDGYTIDIGQWDTHVGSIIYPLNYDLQKDFEPIGLISVNPQLMVARKSLPADDLKGLVAWMKANPGKTTFVNQNAAGQSIKAIANLSPGRSASMPDIPTSDEGGVPGLYIVARLRPVPMACAGPLTEQDRSWVNARRIADAPDPSSSSSTRAG
jgi:tripartite-type tricarboxylate transporter receptor subunit TctC